MTKKEVWHKASLQLQKQDSTLRKIIKKVGPPALEFENDYFKALVHSILSQQLNTKAAQNIIKRVCSPTLPSAKKFLNWTLEEFRSKGVSKQKASYLLDLSRFWQNISWKNQVDKLEDEPLITHLTQVKGIGEWTAQMFLIFSLGRLDVWAVKDYGLQKAIQTLFELKNLPTHNQMEKYGKLWKGYRSVASWYLWHAKDNKEF